MSIAQYKVRVACNKYNGEGGSYDRIIISFDEETGKMITRRGCNYLSYKIVDGTLYFYGVNGEDATRRLTIMPDRWVKYSETTRKITISKKFAVEELLPFCGEYNSIYDTKVQTFAFNVPLLLSIQLKDKSGYTDIRKSTKNGGLVVKVTAKEEVEKLKKDLGKTVEEEQKESYNDILIDKTEKGDYDVKPEVTTADVRDAGIKRLCDQVDSMLAASNDEWMRLKNEFLKLSRHRRNLVEAKRYLLNNLKEEGVRDEDFQSYYPESEDVLKNS